MIEVSATNAQAQAGAYDLARTTVAAGVVGAYTDTCAAGARLAVARRSVSLQRQSLALTERGVKAGIYSPLDSTRLRALLAELESALRSEEHTSELQSLMRTSYAVFCLKKKKNKTHRCVTHSHRITP